MNVKLLLCTICIFHSLSAYQAYHEYFWAYYNHLEQNHDIAASCYEKLLQHQQQSPVYEGFIQHLLQTGDYEHLEQALQLLEHTPQKTVSSQMLHIQALEILGKHQQAHDLALHLYNQYPHVPELAYYTATLQLQHKQYESALKSIDTYLAHALSHQQHFLFYFLKAHIFCALNDVKKALQYAQKSVALYPYFEQGWLLSSMLHESEGNIEQAIAGYSTCLSIIGKNSFIEQQLQHLYSKQQQTHKQADLLFRQAAQLFAHREYHAALEQISTSLTLHSYLPSKLLKFDILCKLHKETDALHYLQDCLLETPQEPILYQALHILTQLPISHREIIMVLHTLEEKHPTLLYPLLYQADIYLRQHEHTQAHHYLQKSLPYTHDPYIRTHILFQLSLLYYQEQQYDSMYRCLAEGKMLGLDFPPLLNLLAHYYTTIVPDLEQAQQLIEMVLVQDPYNPHFLDTQAFIWYKQKKYPQAYAVLMDLAERIHHDATIFYHLAQTAYKLGKKQEVTTWINKAIAITKNDHEKEKLTALCIKNLRIASSAL